MNDAEGWTVGRQQARKELGLGEADPDHDSGLVIPVVFGQDDVARVGLVDTSDPRSSPVQRDFLGDSSNVPIPSSVAVAVHQETASFAVECEQPSASLDEGWSKMNASADRTDREQTCCDREKAR